MAWHLTVCSSPSSIKMTNKNRGEQVLGMVSPQVSPSTRDGEAPCGGGSPKRQFYSAFDQQDEVVEEDTTEDNLPQTEKKRRLTIEQVRFLETSFETENKLEPERKTLIAKQLGLQPRQVAVWFQNRRARWKTKQLELDFEVLKADYNAVVKENEKLQAEVARLTAQLLGADSKKGGGAGLDGGDTVDGKKGSHAVEMPNSSSQLGVKVEELSPPSSDELGSPTKSDQSEVLDSESYFPPALVMAGPPQMKVESATLSPLLKIDESAIVSSEELFGSMYNPLLVQQVAVKLEGGCFSEDSCNFIFTWEEQGMFPWCD